MGDETRVRYSGAICGHASVTIADRSPRASVRPQWYADVVDPFRPVLRALAPLFATSWWPRVRALFVLFHLVAVCAVACPAPVRTFDAKSWARSSVQAELRSWTTRLGQVGVTTTPKELQAFSANVSSQWLVRRRVVVAPFKAWLTRVGAPQGWYMFTGPDREPQRFALSVSSKSSPTTFLPVFELGQPVAEPGLVDVAVIDDHRVRRAMFQSSWSNNDNTLRTICAYFDRDVRARRDDIADVRCALVARPVEHPWRREPVRVDQTVRSVVVHADGSRTEQRDDGPAKTTKSPAKAKSKSKVAK